MTAPIDGDPSIGAVTFRPYRPQDKATLLDIIGRVWDDRRRRLHELLWDWQHARDAEAPDPHHVGQVMEEDGRIVGYSGALPVELVHQDETFFGAVALDTCVEPEYRGLGRRLIRHHLEITSLLMGAPTVRAHALWKRLTRQETIVLCEVTKRIQILDARPFVARRRWPAWLGSLAQAAWSVVRHLHLGARRFVPPPPHRLLSCALFPAEVDEMARVFARSFSFSVLRSARYLNWRFVECPVAYEKRLLYVDDRLVGYVVYRVGTMNGRKILFLIEALAIGRQDDHYGILLDHVTEVAERAGVSDVQTLDTGCPAFAAELTRRGYLSRVDEVSIVGYSNRVGPAIYDGGWFVTAGGADYEFTFFNQGAEDLLAASRPGDAKALC